MTEIGNAQIERWPVPSLQDENPRVKICLPAVPRPGETVVVLGSHGKSYVVKQVG